MSVAAVLSVDCLWAADVGDGDEAIAIAGIIETNADMISNLTPLVIPLPPHHLRGSPHSRARLSLWFRRAPL